jgi:PAS domain S-box-containing protein
MPVRFLTDITPPPPGFEHSALTKRDLLTGNVALLVRTLDEAMTAIEPFRDRVRGGVVTIGDRFHIGRISPLLWHIEVTESSLPDISESMGEMMTIFTEVEQVYERSAHQERLLARTRNDLLVTRQDYDQATERVLERMAVITRLNEELKERIDQQVRMKQSLRESQQSLRTTLDSISDAVIATDAGARITRMNPAACKLTKWSADEAQGLPFAEVVVLKDAKSQLPSSIETFIDHKGTSGPERQTILIDRQGSERRVANRGAPIRSSEDKLEGYVIVLRDITEQHILEQQVQQGHKMEAIGHLAGGVAHDFNNTLAGIIGAAELLNLFVSDRPEALRYVQMILDTSEKAANLVGRLLAFSRKATKISSPIELHGVIEDALAILDRSFDRRIQTVRELTTERIDVVGDPAQLQSAILNLCINARDAMEGGGTLTIGTSLTELDHDACARSLFDIEPGQYVHIFVRDTGTGMTAEVQQHMFEPFFTTKEVGRGTGLGLATIFGTIEEHRGAIQVESTLGQGSVFHLYLPLALERPPLLEAAETSSMQGSGLILMIEDEPLIRTLGSSMLTELGYEVLLAGDGEQGLELFRRHREQIALVILDMVMPKMNGEDCFMAIQAEDPKARVILSSGFTAPDTVHRLRQMGLRGFLKKPFRQRELAQAIQEALRS